MQQSDEVNRINCCDSQMSFHHSIESKHPTNQFMKQNASTIATVKLFELDQMDRNSSLY